MDTKRQKKEGGIYTPYPIVDMMLDFAGYNTPEAISKKHVIDNSCGDGRFLQRIVRRYIENYEGERLRGELAEFIHGIELEHDECEKCKDNLNSILKEYNVEAIDWDIRCENSLLVHDYDGMMDYVFGNPPYVRTHNVKTRNKKTEEDTDYQLFKSYAFAEKGMADLYLAFYELGLRMRNDTGKLCYIAPSPWISSTSGRNMREFIRDTQQLSGVIDFEHIQVFEDAQTYVMVTLFDKESHDKIEYHQYLEDKNIPSIPSGVTYTDIFIDDKMFFANEHDIKILNQVKSNHDKVVSVKNGYATLADDIFIDDLPRLSKYTIPVLKGSTGKWKRCLFPYDENLNPVDLDVIKKEAPDVYDYIMKNEEALKKRTYEKRGDKDYWYVLGRSQGILDTLSNKIAINSIVKSTNDLKIEDVKAGEGIYSGMYIMGNVTKEDIERILCTDSFISYVKSLRKYKSGGYYTFSSKDIENYLNWILK